MSQMMTFKNILPPKQFYQIHGAPITKTFIFMQQHALRPLGRAELNAVLMRYGVPGGRAWKYLQYWESNGVIEEISPHIFRVQPFEDLT